MTMRTAALQEFLDSYAAQCGISSDFMAASDHPFDCKCQKCLAWWKSVGPDPDYDPDEPGAYGPFTREEVEGK